MKPFIWIAALASACVGEATLFAQAAPHATHSARLGGKFAAVASDTLHLEAVWSEQRRVRVFMETASGEALPIERMRDVEAAVVTDMGESPLRLLEAEGYFEARVPTLPPPAKIGVRVRLPRQPDDLVTFTFDTYSADVSGFNAASPTEIPPSLPGIFAALGEDRRRARTLVADQELASLAAIEERLRDRVLAIGAHLAGLPAPAIRAAESTIASVVRDCWLLHMALDYGQPPQVLAALTEIDAGIDRLEAIVTNGRR